MLKFGVQFFVLYDFFSLIFDIKSTIGFFKKVHFLNLNLSFPSLCIPIIFLLDKLNIGEPEEPFSV